MLTIIEQTQSPRISPGYSPGMAADKCRKLTGTALKIQY